MSLGKNSDSNHKSYAGNEQKSSFPISEKILPILFDEDALILPGQYKKEKYEMNI